MWPSFEKSQNLMIEAHLWLHEWDVLIVWCDIIDKNSFDNLMNSYSFAF